jgi:hypothetical protein
MSNGKPQVASKHSLDHAISSVALSTLAKMTPADFVAQLKRQGIKGLDDLATHSLATARAASEAGQFALDPEVFGVCYKFTTARPHFDENTISQVINIVTPALAR